MRESGNTILITGGASGIGFAFAKRLVKKHNEVIICGRRPEQLAFAKKECPELHTLTCDVALERERVRLAQEVTKNFPKLNVLFNNAGIQNRPGPLTEDQTWPKYDQEIEINYKAPVHLSLLFLPHLLNQNPAYLINVSSGLAFAPLPFMAGYCATKAALRSFTMSLRHQLRDTSINVIEVIPPAVNTDLGGKGLHDFGVPLNEFADHAMERLLAGDLEFGYGMSEKARLASPARVID